jgi:CNT family concentrative nucleoside transporter
MEIMRGLLGCSFLILFLYFLSDNKKAISWKLVLSAFVAQTIFVLLVLKVPFVQTGFEYVSSFFVAILNYTHKGSEFLFGPIVDVSKIGFTFAFQILPTIIFFSALTSILFYMGILQRIIYGLSFLLKKIVKISGAENLSTTANIFLGQTEAPLLIKHYLSNMTRSEIFCIMVGGMANTAGGVLAAYVGFLGGSDPEQQLFFAKHLLAASVMSAPATILVAKILVPQTEEISENIEVPQEKIGSNLLEAIANGTTDGLKLAVNVAAMLLVFIALMAMINSILENFVGHYTGLNGLIATWTDGKYTALSLQVVLGYICAPIVWLIGVPSVDMLVVGQLLGEKTILNEFVAYTSLAKLKAENVIQDPRSTLLATYILSGFANFASIGIQIGGIGSLAPSKRSQLAKLGIKALIGGTAATLMMASIVGMIM